MFHNIASLVCRHITCRYRFPRRGREAYTQNIHRCTVICLRQYTVHDVLLYPIVRLKTSDLSQVVRFVKQMVPHPLPMVTWLTFLSYIRYTYHKSCNQYNNFFTWTTEREQIRQSAHHISEYCDTITFIRILKKNEQLVLFSQVCIVKCQAFTQ